MFGLYHTRWNAILTSTTGKNIPKIFKTYDLAYTELLKIKIYREFWKVVKLKKVNSQWEFDQLDNRV